MPELLRGSAASGNSVPGQSATFETETCVVFDLSVGWFCLKIVERSVEARKESSELCGEPAGVQLTHSRVAQAKAAATVCSGTAKHWICDAGRQGVLQLLPFPFDSALLCVQASRLAAARWRLEQCGQGVDLPSP